jgi:hypothetical protein
MTISLFNAAIYTETDLDHQKKAWEFLQANTSAHVIEEFQTRYRLTPKSNEVKEKTKRKPVVLISQRDNKGDKNKDGRPDWYQTCNVTACAMVINSYQGVAVTADQLDTLCLTKFGSRYDHSNLVKIFKHYGLKSVFSTAVKTETIKAHLKGGDLVVWSNKLTHSGHIVVVESYNDFQDSFKIYDPYGEWFESGYQDFREPYDLSVRTFNQKSMNGINSSGHWAHLISK